MELINYDIDEIIKESEKNCNYYATLKEKSDANVKDIINLFWMELSKQQEEFIEKWKGKYNNLLPPFPMIEKFYFFLNTDEREIESLNKDTEKYRMLKRNIKIIDLKKQQIIMSNPYLYRFKMQFEENNSKEIPNITLGVDDDNELFKQIKDANSSKKL